MRLTGILLLCLSAAVSGAQPIQRNAWTTNTDPTTNAYSWSAAQNYPGGMTVSGGLTLTTAPNSLIQTGGSDQLQAATVGSGLSFSGGTPTATGVLPSLVIGAATNTPSFTLVNTNWIDGGLYTNNTGRTIAPWAPCKITMTGVAGFASYSLVVTGVTTNTFGLQTIITSLATSATNKVGGGVYVAPGGTFTFTNTSNGAGDAGAILNGGQYLVF